MQNYLTPFDLKRGPRILPDDYTKEMKFSLETLNFHQCPICLSYMKKTYIVMECLHRFCGDCIQKCLRMGMKECPSCRVHIPSRRSLRPDTAYDTIMEGIYGDIETLEARETREIETFNRKNNMNNSYSQTRHAKKIQQANYRKKGSTPTSKAIEPTVTEAVNAVDTPDVNEASASAQAPQPNIRIHNLKESPLVEFILRKDSRENSVDRLYRECLKVSEEITIGHLKQFLGKKLAHEPYADFHITVNSGGRQVVLDDSIKLKEIRSQICDYYEGMMLILQYFVQTFTMPPIEVDMNNCIDDGVDDDVDDVDDGGCDDE